MSFELAETFDTPENRLKVSKIKKHSSLYMGQSISANNAQGISVGSEVTLYDYTIEEEVIYKIVAPEEGDIISNKLSIESLLGKALIGKNKGDGVQIKTSNGIECYDILNTTNL